MMTLKDKVKKIEITPYKQRLSRGCGPSSLLMILHSYKPDEFPLTPEKEREIYDFSKFGDNDTTATPGLALYALEHGFRVKIYSSYEFPKRASHISQEIYDKYIQIYQDFRSKAKKLGLVEEIGDFSIEDIILKETYQNNLAIVLIMLDQEGEITHNIVVRGHKSNKILCVDPFRDYGPLLKEELEKKMNIPYFKMALVVENPIKHKNIQYTLF